MNKSPIIFCFFSIVIILVLQFVSGSDVFRISEVNSKYPNGGFKIGNCSVLETEELSDYGSKHRYRNGIPKIIHYVYRGSYIPSQYSPLVQQCMQINNDSRFVFWSDFSAYRLIVKRYGNYLDTFSSNFNKTVEPLKISDVIRYFILLEFGGVYMDLDTKCQKPFESVFINESCILSREAEEQTRIMWNLEYLAMNSFMACVPDHAFFHYLVKKLTKADSSWVIAQTGPLFLTNMYKQYMKTVFNQTRRNRKTYVIVADSYTYSPHSEPNLESKCHGTPSGEWKVKGCKNLAEHRKLQKIKSSQAVVVHMFMHLGYYFAKGLIKGLDHICVRFVDFTYVW